MKNTSLNIPEPLFEALELCLISEQVNSGKKKTVTEFIREAIAEKCERIIFEENGGRVLYIENPQAHLETTEETEREIYRLKLAINSLDLKRRLGTDFQLKEHVLYVLQRLILDNDYQRKSYANAAESNTDIQEALNRYNLEKVTGKK